MIVLHRWDGTGQDETGQDRTGQERTGQDRTGQDRTTHHKILQTTLLTLSFAFSSDTILAHLFLQKTLWDFLKDAFYFIFLREKIFPLLTAK